MKNHTETINIPTPDGVTLVRCPKCGSHAHIVDRPKEISSMGVHFYGVECDGGRHKIPCAFSTPISAAHFWDDCAKMSHKKNGFI